jgi:hypothetical protein
MLTSIDCKARGASTQLGAASGCKVPGWIMEAAVNDVQGFLDIAWRL